VDTESTILSMLATPSRNSARVPIKVYSFPNEEISARSPMSAFRNIEPPNGETKPIQRTAPACVTPRPKRTTPGSSGSSIFIRTSAARSWNIYAKTNTTKRTGGIKYRFKRNPRRDRLQFLAPVRERNGQPAKRESTDRDVASLTPKPFERTMWDASLVCPPATWAAPPGCSRCPTPCLRSRHPKAGYRVLLRGPTSFHSDAA